MNPTQEAKLTKWLKNRSKEDLAIILLMVKMEYLLRGGSLPENERPK